MSSQRFKNACPPARDLEGANSTYLSAIHELSLLAEDINELVTLLLFYWTPDSVLIRHT